MTPGADDSEVLTLGHVRRFAKKAGEMAAWCAWAWIVGEHVGQASTWWVSVAFVISCFHLGTWIRRRFPRVGAVAYILAWLPVGYWAWLA